MNATGSGHQFVAGAATAGLASHQDATIDQIADVPIGRVLGTAVHRGPLRRGELPFKTVKESVEDFHLALVQRLGGVGLPEAGLGQDRSQRIPSVFYGAREIFSAYFAEIMGIFLRKPPSGCCRANSGDCGERLSMSGH